MGHGTGQALKRQGIILRGRAFALVSFGFSQDRLFDKLRTSF